MRRLLVVPILALAALLVVGTAGLVLREERPATRPQAQTFRVISTPTHEEAVAELPEERPHRQLERLPHSREVRELLYHLRHGSNRKRREVALKLRELGPAARSAVPEIVACLTHEKNHWGRVRDELAWALAAMGEPALPAVMILLEHEQKSARRSAVEVLRNMEPGTADALAWEIAPLLGTSKEADAALGALGDAGIPVLVAAVRKGEVERKWLWRAVKPLGKPGVRALAHLLSSPDPAVRERAAGLITSSGKNIRAAAPQILDALEDPSFEASSGLLLKAGELGGDAHRAVPAILRRLEKNPFGMIAALTGLGPRAKAALPTLRARYAAADDTDVEKYQLALALHFIDGDEQALAYLAERWHFSPDGKPVVAREQIRDENAHQIRRYPRDEQVAITRAAIEAGRLSPRKAIEYGTLDAGLAQRLRAEVTELDDREDLRLTQAGAPLHTTLPAILALIASKSHEDFVKGLVSLRHHSERTRALPALRKHLGSLAVHIELRRMGPEAAPIVRDLIKRIRGDEPDLQSIETLGALGRTAREALPALQRQRRNERPRFRFAAIHAVYRITNDPNDLRKAFDDPTPRVRRKGADHARHAWAVPDLIDLLRDRDPNVRRTAVRALGRVGRPARDPERALQRIANDEREDESLREHARAALAKIR